MDLAEGEKLCACGKAFVPEYGNSLIYGNLAITACSYHCAVTALAKYLEKKRARERGLSGFGRRRT